MPDWVITEDAARQYEVGMLKTGKEADVHLVERHLGDRVNLLAAKRYRAFEERMFRNDARYRRRVGDRRVQLAMDRGTSAGMEFRAALWVETEFTVLSRLWESGAAVPYPVQRLGNELLLEYVGTREAAAPRLVHARVEREQLPALFDQFVETLTLFLVNDVVHGDLSPYNVLLWEGRLVFIDFPQTVDPLAHPEGLRLLEHDVTTMCNWFTRKGIECNASDVLADLMGHLF
ncbi:MAG TPA: RIO1 family regulatory kinase/ATPase [Acidimicrobiales bacterium]